MVGDGLQAARATSYALAYCVRPVACATCQGTAVLQRAPLTHAQQRTHAEPEQQHASSVLTATSPRLQASYVCTLHRARFQAHRIPHA
eukprot:15467354-Alexandrium_andersonii.AAC.1